MRLRKARDPRMAGVLFTTLALLMITGCGKPPPKKDAPAAGAASRRISASGPSDILAAVVPEASPETEEERRQRAEEMELRNDFAAADLRYDFARRKAERFGAQAPAVVTNRLATAVEERRRAALTYKGYLQSRGYWMRIAPPDRDRIEEAILPAWPPAPSAQEQTAAGPGLAEELGGAANLEQPAQ